MHSKVTYLGASYYLYITPFPASHTPVGAHTRSYLQLPSF